MKLAKGSDGALHGVAGNAAEAMSYLAWVKDGYRGAQPLATTDKDGDSTFIALVVPKSGPLRLVTAKGDETYDAPYFAIGAGAPTALGALFAGASAAQAIEATKEHGAGALGATRTINHEE